MAISLVFLLVLVLVLVLRFRKKQKKQREANEAEDQDENPVYGLYEFADGSNIDEGRFEIVDDNEYYG